MKKPMNPTPDLTDTEAGNTVSPVTNTPESWSFSGDKSQRYMLLRYLALSTAIVAATVLLAGFAAHLWVTR